ncbi:MULTISPECIES: DUF3050 domain-containing protein [Sphingobacterium]|uniref:DUF3050 domain-containing protein n=1 Tax=Sphingobacterium TaxID=28453 RepID=UPI0010433F0B|nr:MULTISPECIES: DUF3050 domain-containing protein [Sphingobacterium]MCW2260504.1 hypothetical protein [Sphingobacterium kitahiroshimense]NJI71618.1 DUF3050 domain-containing protein [Sphingobacterium sp. B16(2022)]TCR00953.1 DUF3050 family protein [Sphingobacterium sp. JUb78]
MEYINNVNAFIATERNQLLAHPLYYKIKTIEDLQVFMQGHIYAVWDFMSLLKALQQKLTCTTTPWYPSKFPNTRYLINEIVVAEESDEYIDGRRLSHFEMYLDALDTLRGDSSEVNNFLKDVYEGGDILKVIAESTLHPNIKEFLIFTFDVIANGTAHEIAAAFTFGREDLIPDMFSSILKEIQLNFPNSNLEKLLYYFERHIELDADEHGPLAMKMIMELCEADPVKWKQVEQVSKIALQKRIKLWDAIDQML